MKIGYDESMTKNCMMAWWDRVTCGTYDESVLYADHLLHMSVCECVRLRNTHYTWYTWVFKSVLHAEHMLHLLHMSVTCGTPSWVFPREIPWKSREEQAWTLWKWNILLMTKIWIMIMSEDLLSRMEFRVQFLYIVHWNMNNEYASNSSVSSFTNILPTGSQWFHCCSYQMF